MKLKNAIEQVEASEVFKAFKKENPLYYLAHVFYTVGKGETCQIGYYGPDTDRVVVFNAGEPISQAPPEEVFKSQPVVEKLELESVKILLEQALSIAEKAHHEKYPHELISQKIVILQTLKGAVYNITHVTKTFNIFNIKIDAVSGKVLSEHMQSILGLQG